MSDSTFWRAIAIAFVAGLFYVGSGLNPDRSIELPTFRQTAFADDPVTRKHNAEYVFTSSVDGRKIYTWQRLGENPPRFIGESEAILTQ